MKIHNKQSQQEDSQHQHSQHNRKEQSMNLHIQKLVSNMHSQQGG